MLDPTPQVRVNLTLIQLETSLELGMKRCLGAICYGSSMIFQNTTILSMVVKGKMYTNDKLMKICISNDQVCIFCNRLLETLSHLFSSCLVTRRV